MGERDNNSNNNENCYNDIPLMEGGGWMVCTRARYARLI